MHHPEVEQKVAAEVKQVLGHHMAAPDSNIAVKASYGEIRELRFTHACYLEALRLHPSVPEVNRTQLGGGPSIACACSV
jgi:cytochrome P450